MDDHFRRLLDCLGSGQRVFIAWVVENSRHSPGTAGAKLLSTETGQTSGTVGGGVMERNILARGRRALAAGNLPPTLERLQHRRETDGRASGMICAGHQSNLYAALDESDLGWVREVVRRRTNDEPGWLLASDRGFAVLDEPELSEGQGPHRLEVDAEAGRFRYQRDLLERRRLVIFGGGHCALALTRVMRPLGYRIEVCEAAKKEPEAELGDLVAALHQVEDFRHAADLCRWPELSLAVVMTSDFPSDVAALTGALGRPFPFLGLMGSPAKLAEIRSRLLAEGFEEDDLARIHAPVGLPIGSHTPEEIAISIAAQVLELRGSKASRRPVGRE